MSNLEQIRLNNIKIIKDKFKAHLASRRNISYHIMVDYKLVKASHSLAIMRYEFDADNNSKLRIGNSVKIDSKSVFKDNSSVEEKLFDLLLSKEIFGLDFTANLSDDFMCKGIEITIYDNLKLICIKSALFKFLFNHVYINQDASGLIQGNRDFTDEERVIINTGLDDYLLDAYYDTVVNKLANTLVSSRVKVLEFYNLTYGNTPVFVPVFVEAPFLYNPFLNGKLFDTIKYTKFYTESCKVKKEYRDMTIYYLTTKQICEYMNFKKYIRPPMNMVLKLLLGVFDDRYPNNNTYKFFRIDNAPPELPVSLDEDEYLRLLKEVEPIRQFYLKQVSMYGLAKDYYLKSGIGKSDLLLDVLSEVFLVVD